MGGHFWHDGGSQAYQQYARAMDATRRDLILQRWNAIQHEVFPELRNEVGAITPKLERVVYILEWVRIGEFVPPSATVSTAALSAPMRVLMTSSAPGTSWSSPHRKS